MPRMVFIKKIYNSSLRSFVKLLFSSYNIAFKVQMTIISSLNRLLMQLEGVAGICAFLQVTFVELGAN